MAVGLEHTHHTTPHTQSTPTHTPTHTKPAAYQPATNQPTNQPPDIIDHPPPPKRTEQQVQTYDESKCIRPSLNAHRVNAQETKGCTREVVLSLLFVSLSSVLLVRISQCLRRPPSPFFLLLDCSPLPEVPGGHHGAAGQQDGRPLLMTESKGKGEGVDHSVCRWLPISQ